MNDVCQPTVEPHARYRDNDPDVTLVEVVDLNGWKHEDIAEWNDSPQSAFELRLDFTFVEFDHCESGSEDDGDLNDQCVILV